MKITKKAAVYIAKGVANVGAVVTGLVLQTNESGLPEQTDFPPAAVVEDDGHNHKH